MRRSRRRGRGGYVSLLAMSFAFGLAILGTTLVAGLGAYLSAASREERSVRDRIALESAAAEVLGQLAAGAQVEPYVQKQIDGRTVSVEVSSVVAKRDLRSDPTENLKAALGAAGMPGVAALRLEDVSDLAAASRQGGLDGPHEDCLRRGFTFGRAPAPFDPAPQEDMVAPPQAGGQLDLRAGLRTSRGEEVLWIRARFTGRENGWLLHDYRRLRGRCPSASSPN